MIRARMARPNRGKYAWERRSREFLAANRKFRRHVLQELERTARCSRASSADHSVGGWASRTAGGAPATWR